MATTTVSEQSAHKPQSSMNTGVLLAFAAIYIIWGSTFLAIRIAVQLVPPLFAAGVRFFVAGVLLYTVMRFCGRPRPVGKEWRSLVGIGSLMFVITYGAVFWAEQFVPSGFTSVLEATLPLITITLEVFVFRQQRFAWRLLVAIMIGFGGVLLLMLRNAQHVPILAVRGDPDWIHCLVTRRGAHPFHAAAEVERDHCRSRNAFRGRGAADALRREGRNAPLSPHHHESRAGADLPGHCRFADRFQCLCLVTGPYAGDSCGQPCLREPAGGSGT